MNTNVNSVAITDYMYSKASRAKIPLSGTFELSPVCNFSCKMCYVRKTAKEVAAHSRPALTLEQWLQIAEEAKNQGMLYLLLTGGEPFLWTGFWGLYEKLCQMGFLISINTNGSLIDDKAIQRLREMPPKRVNITLYGASDETYKALCGVEGVFRRVDHAIHGLKEAGIEVKLNASMTPYNVMDLEKIVAYAKEQELFLETATYMFPPVRRDMKMVGQNERFSPKEAAFWRLQCQKLLKSKEQYESFLRNIINGYMMPPGLDESCIDPVDGKIRCRAGNASFWITWDGWMTPCGMMPDPKVDITKGKFEQRWKELIQVSEQVVLSGICGKCSNRKICHSCAAMAFAETGGSAGVPKYLCETVQFLKEYAEEELKKI